MIWLIFLFAWYQVDKASLSASQSSNVLTINTGTIDGVSVIATFTATDKVNLTNEAGEVRVWNGNSAVLAKDQASLVKSGDGKITFAGTNMDALVGNSYDVYITGSLFIRLASQDTVLARTAAVGPYYHLGDEIPESDPAQTYDADQKVKIGTITIANATTINYSSKKAGVANTDAVWFYYSASPKDLEDGDGVADNNNGISNGYGQITVTFE